MKKYQNARLKLLFVIVFTCIVVIGVPACIGMICVAVVGKIFGCLIAGGLSIIFGAVVFNNTEVRNTYERYKNQNLHPRSEPLEIREQIEVLK